MRPVLPVAVLSGWVAFLTAPAAALSPVIHQHLPEARLVGHGEMRWLGITLYTAQLWTPHPQSIGQAWQQTPFALELRYGRRIPGATLAARSSEAITQLGWGNPRQRQEWHEAMLRLFPTVNQGDRLMGLHRPGEGARFFLNDRFLGRIEDPGFSDAFFAIWLDPRTPTPTVRQALLNRSLTPPTQP
jgi:hypothetical protein